MRWGRSGDGATSSNGNGQRHGARVLGNVGPADGREGGERSEGGGSRREGGGGREKGGSGREAAGVRAEMVVGRGRAVGGRVGNNKSEEEKRLGEKSSPHVLSSAELIFVGGGGDRRKLGLEP
ncbi:hypothetical protein BS78_05G126900 [Paspalum vaginatum]|nr:hypothetical protein BS78_05G126900 [Paspalum vaginatum]